MELIKTSNYLLLINKEAEIKPDDYIIHDTVEGVVEANDEWHYRGEKDDYWNKVIAYRSLTKEAKELDLPLLPPFEEINIQKIADDWFEKQGLNIYNSYDKRPSFIEGYKAAQSRQFSLEDMETLMEESISWFGGGRDKDISDSKTFFEKYIQSLSTQQFPSGFIPKYEAKTEFGPFKFKTITNSEGKDEIQGIYKY